MTTPVSDDLFRVFMEEANDFVAEMEADLIGLEADPCDSSLIDKIFRAAHTIKGGSGIVGLDDISRLTHIMEDRLGSVRSGELAAGSELVSLLLRAVDELRYLLDSVGQPPEESRLRSLEDVTEALKNFTSGPPPAPAMEVEVEADEAPPVPEAPQGPRSFDVELRLLPTVLQDGVDPLQLLTDLESVGALEGLVTDTSRVPSLEELDPALFHIGWYFQISPEEGSSSLEEAFMFLSEEHPIRIEPLDAPELPSVDEGTRLLGEILVDEGMVGPEEVEEALTKQKPKPLGEILIDDGKLSGEELSVALDKQSKERKGQQKAASVRVEASKLDKLLNLVGEVVINHTRIVQLSRDQLGAESHEILNALGDLDRITRQLQDNVMKVRMVPIGTLFHRFHRVVRDLAQTCGRQVKLSISGEETELDKTMVEVLGDPLTHMIRNSIDHGMEPEEERRTAGKEPVGSISLEAYYREGAVVVDVRDDGRGLDREAILQKARQKGLVGQSDPISDEQVFALIFEPGFSTAEQVTGVSGRGVGMDVVRKNIEDLRGSVEIQSWPGKGTLFRIQLPLTLAIIEGMVVRLGSEKFIIPLLTIIESVRLSSANLSTIGGDGEVLRWREEILPLVRLAEVLKMGSTNGDVLEAICIVVEGDGKRAGFVVDEIEGQQQVVIKSIDTHYRKVEGVTGATMLGSGEVALILDVPGILKQVVSRSRDSRA